MGRGLEYKCKKCKTRYSVTPGVGMMFPRVYEETMKGISEGKYGEKWKQIVSDTPYAAVNAYREVYICSSCGSWKQELNLSLYKPNDPEKIRTMEFGIKTVEEWGYVPYVTGWDLKNDYTLIKTFSHKCDKCGKRMHKAKDKELEQLPCPKCGTINISNGMLLWD